MKTSITRLFAIFFLFNCTQCRWNEPPPKNTIVFALSSEPKSFDPRFATDASGQRVLKLIFSSLVRVGADLNIIGDIADSWTYENLTYHFVIKPHVEFHDGSPLTFADLQFSVNEYKKSSSPFSAQFKNIEKVTGEYDFTKGGHLHIKLSQFSSAFLNDLPSLAILPQKDVEKMGDQFYAKPIGSGPFILEKMELKTIDLKRNDKYFAEKSVSEKIQFKIIKDSNTRFQKMYKGQIDIIQSDVPYSKIKVFDKSDKFNVYTEESLSTVYVLLNLRKDFLKSRDVRHAMSQAIQREEIIRYTQEGFATPATSILTIANPYHLKGLKYPIMPTKEVRRLLKSGPEKPLILKTSNTQEAIENGKIITHQLRSMGLNVEQQSYEWGTYYEDVRTGNFDIAIMKWVGINDPDIYRISLHSKMTPPNRNRGYYNNPVFDKLVDSASQEPDSLKRMDLYHQAQKIVFLDLPTIPLWYEKQIAITHKRVKNYSLPINGDFSSLLKVYKDDGP